jgi:hypothetical protein
MFQYYDGEQTENYKKLRQKCNKLNFGHCRTSRQEAGECNKGVKEDM